ncbi:TraR/DksA family transcriptional regulator [Nitritalea halalkaliphila LW7]|uniref:TraR/DksA family transcriptional regulator n=1 Tax=Nitritalea halalkaliphila LW7 TaxID=1189621 RepID=I5BUW4_9BACT|nr:TraR/DksA C4-type zinc finger protein [Nitritalea halalkaliphila]EIM73366.1 TraR/DksA family transcriptional regulator [Nitritalea halalkaliphila LW7]
MSQEEKTSYSQEELREFEQLIHEKLAVAKQELTMLKDTLGKRNDSGTDYTASTSKVLEDGADTLERESINQLAARQQKFIINLEKALMRIKNGTYGICVDTGKLIAKERLRAVPHTMHSIEAKLAKR